MLTTTLTIAAFILFLMAGFNVGGKFNLTAFGLECLTLKLLLAAGAL